MTEREPDITDEWETTSNPDYLLPSYATPALAKRIGGFLILLTHRNVTLCEYHPKFDMDYIQVDNTEIADAVHLYKSGDPRVGELWDYLDERWHYKTRGYRPHDDEVVGFVEYQKRRLDPDYDQFENPIKYYRNDNPNPGAI